MKPILFNGEMVKAILDGRKTVTRRPIKKQPPTGLRWIGWILSSTMRKIEGCAFWGESSWAHENHYAKPPYQVGDILYARETFTRYQTANYIRRPDGRSFSEISDGQFAYRADGFGTIEDLREHIRLMSDCSLEEVFIEDEKWRPSIHMPREAARLFLRVTGVRVERLRAITEEDAINEGVPCCTGNGGVYPNAATSFRVLWDSVYSKRGYGWEQNPWVWVIDFERCPP